MNSPWQVEPVHPRLWRSRGDKVMAGVVGGLAEKFTLNPTFARVLWVGGTIFTGVMPGVVAYLLLWSITRQHDIAGFRLPEERDRLAARYDPHDRYSSHDR